MTKFLSTPSARRATDRAAGRVAYLRISIHALCEEGDAGPARLIDLLGISIHALCEEGDKVGNQSLTHPNEFLSTPSARRATSLLVELAPVCEFLSTPSARRATQTGQLRVLGLDISIHALCEEGDFSAFTSSLR